jgi:hypothetical protein
MYQNPALKGRSYQQHLIGTETKRKNHLLVKTPVSELRTCFPLTRGSPRRQHSQYIPAVFVFKSDENRAANDEIVALLLVSDFV